MEINLSLSRELSIPPLQVQAAVKLLDQGCTVPFIARYRKEATGGLDDTALRNLFDRLNYLRGLEKRRQEIVRIIEEQGGLTGELASAIAKAQTLAALEDIYLPFRKKRRTRATAAKEKGLEPLALLIMEQGGADPLKEAEKFIDEQKGIGSAEQALDAAGDIIAEAVSESAEVRGALRRMLWQSAAISSSLVAEEAGVYGMYADFSESLQKVAGYRVLAINRGEKEKVLKVWIECDKELLRAKAASLVTKNKNSLCLDYVIKASDDALTRLILPSLENEIRSELTNTAAEQAIGVFALNLRPLLMQPPLKDCVILGFDPAYRTGCKLAVIDATGDVAETAVIYPTPPHNKTEQAAAVLKDLTDRHGISVIAIGNGTASKESEIFVADFIKRHSPETVYTIVSEAGASVYSASQLGAKEFPQYDVSLRSAISIARRLQDPLAELVKIDPKAIGVGQYQHDMPTARLDEALTGVVEDCVNSVGVDVNTASAPLLAYVSGIGPALAQNIIQHRQQNGPFLNRKTFLEVARFGAKAFEQAAGFLRIAGGDELLDNTGVHPESYEAARRLMGLEANNPGYMLKMGRGELQSTAKSLDIGVPTLEDIILELAKPGRDPRDQLQLPLLRSDLLSVSDLKPGMELDAAVRNVVDFGAFVDIGVGQDGLVHISQISDRFIRHPSEVLRVGDTVRVRVISVDEERRRISLTMRGAPQRRDGIS